MEEHPLEFILRILFSGLIVFVPSEDRQEVTVLLLNVGHAHHLSDDSALDEHKPLLIARAGDCTGQCPTSDPDIAQYLFADKSASAAIDSLEEAVGNGGAWELSGSDLSVRKGSTTDPDLPELTIEEGARGSVNSVLNVIPATSAEREDFSWVADLKQLCPTSCGIDSDLFGNNPPAGLVAARLRLRTGKLFTYSVARNGANVTPVHFKRLDGTGSVSTYSQAVASWVGTEVEISGDSIEIVEEKFNNDPGRTMKLSPDAEGKVEIAILNMPPFVSPSTPFTGTPAVGRHFEMYYEIADTTPAPATRLVPFAGAASGAPAYAVVDWHSIHPTSAVGSELLNKLRMEIGRSDFEQALCPPSQYPRP
jgi:hypothetical protein